MTSPLYLSSCFTGSNGNYTLSPTPNNAWTLPTLLAAYRQANPWYNCWSSIQFNGTSVIACGLVNGGCPNNFVIENSMSPFVASSQPLTITFDVISPPKIAKWEGFGTSLAWWAVAVGKNGLDQQYANLFYTLNDSVSAAYANSGPGSLPGLGFSITRYNIGGTGIPEDSVPPNNVEMYYDGDGSTVGRNTTDKSAWYKLVPGFWAKNDPNAWFWGRDPNQWAIFAAIRAANPSTLVELFSNAPMWWMTDVKSSMGGNLLPEMNSVFISYVANVTAYFVKNLTVPIRSVEILNEPSAGWWNFSITSQEGLNANITQQQSLLTGLRNNLTNALPDVWVSGTDENNPDTAKTNLASILPLVQQYNVHSYWNLDQRRIDLKAKLGNKPFWMTEYGDGDSTGVTLGYTIAHDINLMRPSAWINWQVIDPAWGLMTVNMGQTITRGKVKQVNPKYYVMAQYSRFIRPNDKILSSSDVSNTVVAFDGTSYKIVVGNYASQRNITLDLRTIATARGKAITGPLNTTYTSPLFNKFFQPMSCNVTGNTVTFSADAFAVYSFQIPPS